jgi:NADPH:quinone reductase-like Zn-dependent oxidoreductase
MPTNLTFEQAAAVPVAGLTALQALRDHGKIQPGQRVLVNGAAGGVGTFAVQIAKAFGADVTAVTSTENLALVRTLGAGHVIDYTREDFTRGTQRYDLIVDCGGGHSMLDVRHALTPQGTYVLVGEAHMGRWLEPFVDLFVKPSLLSRVVGQHFVSFIATMNQADLQALRKLIQAGQVRPVIDRRYPLSRMSDALRYLETGHAHGKVVITLE